MRNAQLTVSKRFGYVDLPEQARTLPCVQKLSCALHRPEVIMDCTAVNKRGLIWLDQLVHVRC
jgi:hypothetical protein